MLRLMRERDSLGVVADQIGTPTWTRTLADTLWSFVAQKPHGIFHCADNGVASWYDFAVAIQEEALAIGLVRQSHTHQAAAHRGIPDTCPPPSLQCHGQTRN